MHAATMAYMSADTAAEDAALAILDLPSHDAHLPGGAALSNAGALFHQLHHAPWLKLILHFWAVISPAIMHARAACA
jgi:hypothetical protein